MGTLNVLYCLEYINCSSSCNQCSDIFRGISCWIHGCHIYAKGFYIHAVCPENMDNTGIKEGVRGHSKFTHGVASK